MQQIKVLLPAGGSLAIAVMLLAPRGKAVSQVIELRS
jgi:hypothetical protein